MTKADDNSIELKNPFGDNREMVVHEMICALNREGILDPSNFFSEEVKDTPAATDGVRFQVIFGSDFQFVVPNVEQLFASIDFDNQKYDMLFTSVDLIWYMNEIKSGSSKVVRDALKI